VRHEPGFNTQGGAFGPGLPGRWSICLAENEEESSWPPFAIDGGQPAGVNAVSATLLRTCEFVDNRHTPDPEQVLWDVADTISRPGSLIFRDTSAGVVFCPEHAQLLAGPGARADCLVPENLMRGILGQALGVPDDTIDLTYPSTPS
jgi:hypothetical protein